jgi:hypothetical protein
MTLDTLRNLWAKFKDPVKCIIVGRNATSLYDTRFDQHSV